MYCMKLKRLPHELERSVGRHKGNDPISLKAIVPHTWMEGAVVNQTRVHEGQQQVRHAAQAAVGRDDSCHLRGNNLPILVQYRVYLLNYIQVYFVLCIFYSSLSPRHAVKDW